MNSIDWTELEKEQQKEVDAYKQMIYEKIVVSNRKKNKIKVKAKLKIELSEKQKQIHEVEIKEIGKEKNATGQESRNETRLF